MSHKIKGHFSLNLLIYGFLSQNRLNKGYNPLPLTHHLRQNVKQLLINFEFEFLTELLIRLLINFLNEYLIDYPNQNLFAIILQNIRGDISDD